MKKIFFSLLAISFDAVPAIFTETLSNDGIICDNSTSPFMCVIRSGSTGAFVCTYRAFPLGVRAFNTPLNSNAQVANGLITSPVATLQSAGDYRCRVTNTVVGQIRVVSREFRLLVGGL